MSTLVFNGRRLPVREGETVLDCLLRHGEKVSHSCKSGICQSCLVRGSEGPIPERAQLGLRDSLRALGYFLACTCYPSGNLSILSAGDEQRIPAHITGLDPLSESVLRVHIRPDALFEYRAGQYITLFREDGLARSYSLASLPEEHELELHVRLIAGGNMSSWLRAEARVGTTVWIQGPLGNCFYTEGNPKQPLLLTGTGTGLAPLYGVARDALQCGHTGHIWLFHGALAERGLYLRRELLSLSERFPNFHYVPTVLEGTAPVGGKNGALESCILGMFPDLEGWRGFVCGDPGFVNGFRKKIFLAGMASKEIYADAFLPAAPEAPHASQA